MISSFCGLLTGFCSSMEASCTPCCFICTTAWGWGCGWGGGCSKKPLQLRGKW
ncbi:hypothetical protein Hanom_Chr09g00816811 [Helianthus anomalus]